MGSGVGFGACRLDASASLRFSELCAAGSQQTELSIVPRPVATYDGLAELLATNLASIVWAPPVVALDLLDRGLATLLALPERHGLLTSNVAFVVRKGGPRSLAELRGKRVVWLDRRSASGYVIPRLNMYASGMDPATFFAKETFADTQLAMIDAVAAGRVDTGTTWCRVHPVTHAIVNAGWTRPDGTPIRPIDVAHTIGPVPNDAILVSKDLHAADRSALARWLLNPSPRSRGPLVDLMSTSAFRIPTSDHFETLRHMLRAARARGYLEMP
jgi:ABC-type phosphate/phosphonate transport system substrate-binding protein